MRLPRPLSFRWWRQARPSDGSPTLLWLTPALIDALGSEADRKHPLETGGVLLGHECDDGGWRQLLVTELVGPGPSAKHKRARFSPDSGWQQRQIAAAYRRAGCRLQYLGDWHSHPVGSLRPSRRDLRTARRIAGAVAARNPRPVMLIVGPGQRSDPDMAATTLEGGQMLPVEIGVEP